MEVLSLSSNLWYNACRLQVMTFYTSKCICYYLCIYRFPDFFFFLPDAPGTSESFLHAVANESQLKQSNKYLLRFSGIYIVLNVILIRYAGAVGLIAANSLSILVTRSFSCVTRLVF